MNNVALGKQVRAVWIETLQKITKITKKSVKTSTVCFTARVVMWCKENTVKHNHKEIRRINKARYLLSPRYAKI